MTPRRRAGGCPWWLLLLIGLIGFLLLLGLIAGLISLFSGNKDHEKVVHRPHDGRAKGHRNNHRVPVKRP